MANTPSIPDVSPMHEHEIASLLREVSNPRKCSYPSEWLEKSVETAILEPICLLSF